MSFYDKYNELCVKKGVTPTKAARDNGISQSVISMWKKRGSTPKIETIQKLSDYFEVPIETFSPKPVLQGFGRVLDQLFEDVHNEFPDDSEINRELAELEQLRRELVGKGKLNEAFSKLNSEGQQIAIERVQELTEIPRYRRADAPPQSPEDKDTPAAEKHAEEPTEGE